MATEKYGCQTRWPLPVDVGALNFNGLSSTFSGAIRRSYQGTRKGQGGWKTMRVQSQLPSLCSYLDGKALYMKSCFCCGQMWVFSATKSILMSEAMQMHVRTNFMRLFEWGILDFVFCCVKNCFHCGQMWVFYCPKMCLMWVHFI